MSFYRAIRRLFLLIAGPMFRFRSSGVEEIPARGPAVLVAPHRSWLDPPCIGAACPRPVRFLIVDKVYRKPWARWFYWCMSGIPVSPGGLGSLRAVREALRALQRGEVVGIFPEGRVVPPGEESPIHPGAALLASRARAPVVPAGIWGSARAWPRGRRLPRPAPVRVRFFEAISPPRTRGSEGRRQMQRELEVAMRDLRTAIAAEDGS